MTNYALSPHIHATRLNGVYVLLDEAADSYLCLSETQSGLLADVLAGDIRPEACRFATALAARQILIPDSPAPQDRPAPSRTTSSVYRSHATGHLRPQEWTATWRVLRAARKLHKRSLAEKLAALRHDKAGRRFISPAQPEQSGDAAARFTAVCDLFLTRTDACLSRSLLLAQFLIRCRIPADLVLGVRLGPFAAHAWVECGGCVVSDHLETVQEYAPILSI